MTIYDYMLYLRNRATAYQNEHKSESAIYTQLQELIAGIDYATKQMDNELKTRDAMIAKLQRKIERLSK